MLRLLGPVEVDQPSVVPVSTDTPRARLVLASLAADVGRPVPVDVLVDRVWGTEPSPHVRRTLQSYIARIRRLLRGEPSTSGEPVHIERTGHAYLLRLDPAQVDLHRFRQLAAQARQPDRAPRQRIGLLRSALDLWRGEPLSGLDSPWVSRARAAWQQERMAAMVAWADAEADGGDPANALVALSDLAAENPLAEPLAAALIRILVKTGRTGDALRRYEQIRVRLADELGVDPGPELRSLHLAILRSEIADVPLPPLDVSTTHSGVRGSTERPRRVAAQLPINLVGFVGRTIEMAALNAEPAAVNGTATRVVVLSGTAGVGKTTLAVHWAHQKLGRYPDGQLFLNLRGFSDRGLPLSPAAAIRRLLEAFDIHPERLPADFEAQVALFRSVTADRRMLILLDNARDAAQVRSLIPGGAGCLVLVTSRNRLSGLASSHAAELIALDPLTASDAREVLARRLGADRITREPVATREIIVRCAGLPLALSIVAAHALTHHREPLSHFAGQLREASSRLDTFTIGEDSSTDVRALLSWSYRALSPATAELFRLLSLHPGPDFTLATAASLAGQPRQRTRRLLSELANASLLIEHVPDRYTFHDLLRAYARELTDVVDSTDVRRAALRRMLDHYLHTAHAATALIDPQRDPISIDAPEPHSVVEPLADPGEALAWFTADHRAILGVLHDATPRAFDEHIWKLAWCLRTLFRRHGHWPDWADAAQAAIAAAERLQDPIAQAHSHCGYGIASSQLARHEEAHSHYTKALDLFHRVGDAAGEAATHLRLAWLSQRQAEFDVVLRHAQRALALYRDAGHAAGSAWALNTACCAQIQAGNYVEALTQCESAVARLQQLNDPYAEAWTWDSLGHAHHHLGSHDEAAVFYRKSVRLLHQSGDRYAEAEVHEHLGDTYDAAGHARDAGRAWRDALQILEELRHPDASRVLAKLSSAQR